MRTKKKLACIVLTSALFLPLSANAQSCDTCSQLSTLNAYTQDIDTNSAASNNLLSSLLTLLTNALFSTLPSIANTQAALTSLPEVQKNSYVAQQNLLHAVEAAYNGSSSNDATLTNNYKTIFQNYLLQEKDSAPTFDPNNASIASLYVNPAAAGSYSEDQKLAAQRYIMLASGAAISTAQKPGSWLKINSDNPDPDKKKIRNAVSNYYTLSAIQSAIADNFAYVYGLNAPQPLIYGPLENYEGNTISESGLFTYIATQKVENAQWYIDINGMGIGGLLKEQTIVLGSCFLMLSRIEEDLRRLLITNSTQATLSLAMAQQMTQASTQAADVQKLLNPS